MNRIGIAIIATVAAIGAGFVVPPVGQAAQKPLEPVQFSGGKIVNRLPQQDGAPQSRVVRVVYPSHIAAHR